MLQWRAALLASPSHGEVSDDIRMHDERTLQRCALPASYNAVARLQDMQPHLLLTTAGTPSAMLQSAVGFAAFSYVMDKFQPAQEAHAASRRPAQVGIGLRIQLLCTVAQLHIQHPPVHTAKARPCTPGSLMKRLSATIQMWCTAWCPTRCRCVLYCMCRHVRTFSTTGLVQISPRSPLADSALPSFYASNQLRVCSV